MLTKKRREETAWSRELPKVGSMEVACERMMTTAVGERWRWPSMRDAKWCSSTRRDMRRVRRVAMRWKRAADVGDGAGAKPYKDSGMPTPRPPREGRRRQYWRVLSIASPDGWLAAERRRGERSHEMSDVEAQGGGKQEKETPGDGQPERREASARSGVRKPRGVASLERRAAADKRGRPSRISSHTVVGPSGGRWMRPSSKSASTDSIMVGWVGWAVRWRWEGGV